MSLNSQDDGLTGQGHLLRLVAQADRMSDRLDQLLEETQDSGAQVAILTRHLTDPATTRPTDERLAELLDRLEANQERLAEIVQAVVKLSRTQFKSNTLAEAKDQQIASALTTLQDIATRREQVQEARTLQKQALLKELRAEARGELAADLLPVLDGMELALDSGGALLARRRAQAAQAAQAARAQPPTPPRPKSWWQKWWWWALVGRPSSAPKAPRAAPPEAQSDVADETPDMLEGWLRGLELVRERFLSLLALESIQPILAQGQPFDPRLHVAVEAQVGAAVQPGVVVTVLRKGYRQRARVLRYAEVVVSRASQPEKAPDVQEKAPDVQESAPDVQESAPDVQESAPDVQESAPDVQESAPDVSQTEPGWGTLCVKQPDEISTPPGEVIASEQDGIIWEEKDEL
ncbi:MAG: nucleotide exchange factor GrpE [Chloroflexi bacterium HGW-Chloroflexi-1]|nr:MAG: nucleotide exchange factor GrpE [Chloroflexi bacterium HGW-Chloroflexi-1]